MQSGLIVPLRAGDEVIGTLNFLAERAGHYTQDDLRVVSALAAQVSAAAQNSRLFREATDARNQLRIVLESISDGVVVLGEDGRVLHANSGALRLLHGDSIAPGRHMLSVAARARARGQRLLDREQLRGLAGQFQRHSGGTLRLSDGRHIEWAAARLLEGAITPGFVISLRDISDKVALEQLREDMISMLVHDLRTPLTGVLLSLDMLTQSRASGLALEEGELIDRASESAKQLLRHINALLDMSKLEAGRLELEIQPLSVAPLLARVAGRFRLLAELGKMQLVIDAPPELPALPADPILIERVLENLIGNALKFTDEGGAVTVGARPLPGPEPALELYVRDTGVGVPPELRTVIFEKYGQAHNPRARRGTGLGLTFCKLAVEAHCGRIGLRETPGGGSTFWVELPLSGGR
jgi:signal transduction histidine kinase